MEPDTYFDGFTHESLPEVTHDFSCKSSGASRRPDAVVDINHDGEWIRLPITRCETRVNKDGVSDVMSSTRVDLPVTWGRSTARDKDKVPIYEYVGETQKRGEEEASFDLGRVYYWNEYSERYSIEQFGYVASVGPAPQNGTFRFYIYDAADLMKNLPVTKSYDSPTASGVANFVAFDEQYGLNENSPIPVKGVSTTIPLEEAELTGPVETTNNLIAGWVSENVPIIKASDGDIFEDLSRLSPINLVAFDIFETLQENEKWLDDQLQSGGHKHFIKNRHTLADVMNWLTDEIGGSWYFEPVEDGVILVVNNGAEAGEFSIARSSYYDGFDPSPFDYLQGFNHQEVNILNNTALEDIKPINYLELNGESADSFLGVNADREIIEGPLGAPRGHTDKYPHVEVSYPPLLERTGGHQLGPKPIESGTSTLSEAREEAVTRFKEAHEDNTDGEIQVHALPSVRPYDYIAATPICNDTFDADMDPIQYEVNSVTHVVSADERYKTNLGVSIALNEAAITTKATFENINE